MDDSKIKYFSFIPAVPDRGMILTRLGYRKTSTVLAEDYTKRLDGMINEGIQMCNAKGVFGRYAITERSGNHVMLECGLVFKSASLAKLLFKSTEVVLMAATVGNEITDRISCEMTDGDAAFGVILDATASETADAALDWIVQSINRLIRMEGRSLTKMRYSPGYGDLPLFNQKNIFEVLHLEELGLRITESCMLVPEKSVIAIAGIEGIE